MYLGEAMGKLIIDGNSVFEIDEECIKKKKISKDCDIEKYIKKEKQNKHKHTSKKAAE